ncbi:3-oxoacyl-[acyl-carrier-protein] synthase-3 [Cyclonatronum proteinivorum]|uniref:3-oxoacyl-[acyl-carrier-protein] synthase-3 n=1 Tax=Cyclonatronum proteinivorum TaxID=1457365 RepID=A0A345UMF8_9BACT|nr:ketoacyl-ACP synthase III [Cyclonatronum proteinivorum]AXJ01660.1 3-oxoacyl-[acyl-carrier-protein] synthase-3 [Cyclonatronum proteinivorum]
MAFLTFENIGISGLAAAVPANTIENEAYTMHFPAEDVKQIVEKTGIRQRRFAPKGMTASDLCFAAADKLLNDMQISREEIDAVIFVSQTPDYRMPATSVILQDKLGLPKSTLAFDINLGCSAFVYGLSVAYSFMQQQGFRHVLLLDGETRSRVYHPKDRKTGFLFGDGGVAALISRDERYGKSCFSLNSDGSRQDLIKMDAGGYRNPSTPETLKEKVVDEHGNIRTDEHGYMNGADVFNFAIREVPKNIKETLAFAQTEKEAIDYFVLHQANIYMNSYLSKKLKLPDERVPTNLDRFGNTSSVSIPLAIATELQEALKQPQRLLLCGFGVGMSWATGILNTGPCHIPDLIELEAEEY